MAQHLKTENITNTDLIEETQCCKIEDTIMNLENEARRNEDVNVQTNESVENEQKYESSGSRKAANRKFSEHLINFANEGSIICLYKLAIPSDYFGASLRKLQWAILLLFGVGFMVYQIQSRVVYYLSYPTKVNYELRYNESLRFPTVTLCSGTLISKQKLNAYGEDVIEVVKQVYPPFPGLDVSPPNYTLFKNIVWNDSWDSFYNSLTSDPKDILLKCTFNNEPCNSTDALKETFTDFGDCISFNPSTANYQTTQPGSKYGLRLVLYYNQSDSAATTSPAAGFVVVLHDKKEKQPFVSLTGFRISPGKSTSVAITFRNVSQLPSPYGTCTDEENYTNMNCEKICLSKYFEEKCNCSCYILKDTSTLQICDPYTYALCGPPTAKKYTSTKAALKCDCPLECHRPSYPYSISTSPLSQLYLNYTSKLLNFKGKNISMSKLNREIAYVNIFYSSLVFTSVKTIPAYSGLGLFSDIGGTLGLILGASVLSAFEIFQLILKILAELFHAK